MRERRLPSSVEVKFPRDLKAMFFHEGSISIVGITDNILVRLKTFKALDNGRTIPQKQVLDELHLRVRKVIAI